MSRNRSSLTPREFAFSVVDQLQQAGFTALWAGGCVRDQLMGSEPSDYDVATSATPEQVRKLFGHKKTLAVGEQFGVIIVIGPKPVGNVEVATFRSDGAYTDGRRPDSVVFSTPQQDAQRRDFTINGMFYDPVAETLHDYVGGEQDLKQKQIRAIGEAHQRIQEDKLRMLRAVRFATRFGFGLETSTSDAVRNDAAQIHAVSVERIVQELRKMFEHPARHHAYRQLVELGLWQQLFPMLPSHPEEYTRTQKLLEQTQIADWCLTFWWSLEPRSAHSPACEALDLGRKWRLSNEETETLQWLSRNWGQLTGCALQKVSLAQLKTVLASKHSSLLLEAMRVAAVVNADSEGMHDYEFAEQYRTQSTAEQLAPQPLLTGQDLIQAGFKPGPQFKQLLGDAYELQLNEQFETKSSALNWLASQT